MRVTGWVVTGLMVAFLVMDGVMKLVQPPQVLQASAPLGFTGPMLTWIGVALLLSTALYVFPRTAVLGAVLLTGYLGGAVATQLRAGAGAVGMMFPVVFCVLVWGGLWLRDARLRKLTPLVASV